MTTLSLEMNLSNSLKTLRLPAETVIETKLVVASGRASLPTLISVENIISHINNAGFELVFASEIDRISTLVNNYYLPIPTPSWQNKTLQLRVRKLSLSKSQYNEVRKIRTSVLNAADKVTHYENLNNHIKSKQEQDKVWENIARSKSPSWWQENKAEIFRFITTTALSILIDSLLGIPLRRFIENIIIV